MAIRNVMTRPLTLATLISEDSRGTRHWDRIDIEGGTTGGYQAFYWQFDAARTLRFIELINCELLGLRVGNVSVLEPDERLPPGMWELRLPDAPDTTVAPQVMVTAVVFHHGSNLCPNCKF